MTKKQLEKYRKEFDEFVANVEKMFFTRQSKIHA